MEILRHPFSLLASLVVGIVGLILIMVFYVKYTRHDKDSSKPKPSNGLYVAGLIMIALMMVHYMILSGFLIMNR